MLTAFLAHWTDFIPSLHTRPGQTHADVIFAYLVYAAWPATLLYPIIYGVTAKWWRSWIGRALMVEAIGVFTLLTFSVLFQWFGPGYWGRDFIRISGMSVSLLGFWLVLFALVRVRIDVKRGVVEDIPPQ